MQEAATDASAAAGYDRVWYHENGHFWLIRETDIEYFQPLHVDEKVEITTYVLDFKRVRSRRIYEFRRKGEEALAAKAITDWVYLNAMTGRPATIPTEMKAGFFPEGIPESFPPRERFPDSPSAPPGAFILYRYAEWRDIDSVQHVNNATYLSYIEDCSVRDAAAQGWPMARMAEEGFGIIARRHQIEYRVPAVLDDKLAISTWISDVRSVSAKRHYTVKRDADDALLARAQTVWVWVDIKTGKPIRIPPHFMDAFKARVVEKN
jgi:acyl-CoA thioester hydrolase